MQFWNIWKCNHKFKLAVWHNAGIPPFNTVEFKPGQNQKRINLAFTLLTNSTWKKKKIQTAFMSLPLSVSSAAAPQRSQQHGELEIRTSPLPLETWGYNWLFDSYANKRWKQDVPCTEETAESIRWDPRLDRGGRTVHEKLRRRSQIKRDREGRAWWPKATPPPPPPHPRKINPGPNIRLHLGLLKWLLGGEHRKQNKTTGWRISAHFWN